ncbi:MAG: ABC transporter ATP-binding protein [Thermodesulfovibrionales bacterium]|nr:ABC transporter ATP-binding protein [Thermodesulfovibrionales bacterium]
MSSRADLPILELSEVGFGYDRNASFISSLSCSILNGQFIGLLGANGSGKSTILKLASGILKPSTGQVTLWGKSLHQYRQKDRAKLISYLPQFLDMHIPFTVRELVSMGLYPYDILPDMTAEEAMELVGLRRKADIPIAQLSGGERRRAFIAMTLLQGSGLVLLDEPLVNLDIKFQLEIYRLLKELQKQKNISILMALHDMNFAMQFEAVMLIKQGSILGAGTPEEVLTKDTIRDAFDVDVTVRKQDSGEMIISYTRNTGERLQD